MYSIFLFNKMKKIAVIYFILICGTFFCKAQPNGGFENWTTVLNIIEPENWQTYNFFSLVDPLTPVSATRVSGLDKHSGIYALKIKSIYIPNNQFSSYIGDTAGGAFTGNFDFTPFQINWGFPYIERPARLEVWSKYLPLGNDTAGAAVVLKKWVGNKTDTIAIGKLFINQTLAYTKYEVNLAYYSSEIPDSAVIVFLASKEPSSARINSTLFIDDVVFAGSVGIDKPNKTDGIVKISPNPSKDEVNIKSSFPNSDIIKIINITGKIIGEFKIYDNEFNINTSTFAAGIYYYEIQDNRAKNLYKGKFNVIK